ncbi:hypothetical protein BASA81_000682 [Batrachochytrium salamandrivorans]|nr:hypothetical protein BASA81_000682 [Batrachochytrium salamandrivorans]
MNTKRLRLVVEERKRLEGLVSKESTAARDRRKLLLGFGEFFDQVYLYFLSAKHSSFELGELCLALEQRSLNQKIHVKTARIGLEMLAEWCQISAKGSFVVFSKRKLKPSLLRAKITTAAQLKLDQDNHDDDGDDEREAAV